MFITFLVALGFFLLLAARRPAEYWTVIAFAGWQSLAHSAVMIIQTVQAYSHGTPRDFKDVIIAAVIGAALLALVPPRQQPVAATSKAGNNCFEHTIISILQLSFSFPPNVPTKIGTSVNWLIMLIFAHGTVQFVIIILLLGPSWSVNRYTSRVR